MTDIIKEETFFQKFNLPTIMPLIITISLNFSFKTIYLGKTVNTKVEKGRATVCRLRMESSLFTVKMDNIG